MVGFCPQLQNQEEDALLLDLFSKRPFLENFPTLESYPLGSDPN